MYKAKELEAKLLRMCRVESEDVKFLLNSDALLESKSIDIEQLLIKVKKLEDDIKLLRIQRNAYKRNAKRYAEIIKDLRQLVIRTKI